MCGIRKLSPSIPSVPPVLFRAKLTRSSPTTTGTSLGGRRPLTSDRPPEVLLPRLLYRIRPTQAARL